MTQTDRRHFSASRERSRSATATRLIPRIVGSTASKALCGLGIMLLSFWLAFQFMERLQSEWEPVRSNTILTFGDASASAISLSKDVKFQFPGIGYVEIQGTRDLQCLKFKCRFSLVATFAPTKADPQFIIGQSFFGEVGWHLLLGGGRLFLQTDGGAIEMAAEFRPRSGQRYQIDIVRDDQEVSFAVDGIVLAKSKAIPFTDLARDLTIGGRAGPVLIPFAGVMSELQIARRIPRE